MDAIGQCERGSEGVLATLGPTHDADPSELEVVEERHQISRDPGQQAMLRQPRGAVYPGPVRGDDAQSQRPGQLVSRAHVVPTQQSAVAVDHRRTRWVTVDGEAERAAIPKTQGMVTRCRMHLRSSPLVGDAMSVRQD